MSNLLWPGDHRAGALMSDHAFFDALVTVENAWLATLIEAGVAPPDAATDLAEILGADDIESTAVGSERDGNPVTGLVALLRERAGTATARWIHRGLTSQDVVDSALALCLRDALNVVREQLSGQIATVLGLVEKYRDTAVLTHTLTQPALPGTGGRRFSVWLTALLDAADTLATLPPLPVQAGGAAGTMAAATELTGSAEAALALTESLAGRVGLTSAMPWHTTRSVPTRVGDALVGCTDAWGHLANDIALGCRAEIGEYTEGSGGGSSTMPHKSNPALSVLVRRAALAAPALGATLHTASAASVDERADGGWHAEWDTVRILTRRTVVAALQTSDLLTHLHFDADRAEANLAAAEGLLAEQRAMTELTGRCDTATRAPPPEGEDVSGYEDGMTVRREVLGDAHVDRAVAATTDFTADFQDLITRYAWGEIWTRPGLDRKSRSIITLTALVARGHHEELAMHVRAARRNGLTVDQIKEILLQSAIYCGVPDANTAFRIAGEVLAEERP